jgi:hypothetical protein
MQPQSPATLSYLVAFGVSGWFDRFTASEAIELSRGDRVLLRTHRGLEPGTVLCACTLGHERFLQDHPPGECTRRMNDEDEARAAGLAEQTNRVYDAARSLAHELGLTLDVVDVEAVFEPRSFILHHWGTPADVRPFVSRLSKQFDAFIELMNLAGELQAEDQHGCEVCGSTEGGGCGESGGCGTEGGCGTSKKQMSPAEWQAYFAELRKRMSPN